MPELIMKGIHYTDSRLDGRADSIYINALLLQKRAQKD